MAASEEWRARMSISDPHCAFCRIVGGQLSAEQVYATEDVVAFRDSNPQAPTHVLVVPRRHVPFIAALGAEDGPLLASLFAAANHVARELGVADTGYRLVLNQGPNAGQTVQHLHLHVLGGRRLSWPPG
jgi:histidine triad (HIT) family protein